VSWKDIVGHESQIKSLIQAWKSARLGQGYFFHGIEGIGKKTLAIEFGKALLCSFLDDNLGACNNCASCKLVDSSNHPDLQVHSCPEDVQEFPLALMSAICSQFSLKASRGGAKVLVIDDCDLLNEESGNRFLKSLEEPPPYSSIFLIGISLERQLETIISRCQKIAFFGLSSSEILQVINAKELVDEGGLGKIPKNCNGSVSRALLLTNPEFSLMQDAFFAELILPAPDSIKLVKMVMDFLEAAGKESSSQRVRAKWLVYETLTWLRDQFLPRSGKEEGTSRFRLSFGDNPSRIVLMMDFCFQAEFQIERRVQLILLIQNWIDQLLYGE